MTWIAAPSGLYTLQGGQAVPILAINEQGRGLLPGGGETTNIYVHLNGWTPSPPARTYQEIVRDTRAEECPHGEPRGGYYCAHCRRTEPRYATPAHRLPN